MSRMFITGYICDLILGCFCLVLKREAQALRELDPLTGRMRSCVTDGRRWDCSRALHPGSWDPLMACSHIRLGSTAMTQHPKPRREVSVPVSTRAKCGVHVMHKGTGVKKCSLTLKLAGISRRGVENQSDFSPDMLR